MPTVPLTALLRRENVRPDFELLCVDAEGLDVGVLESNDWDEFHPKVVVVDAPTPDLAEVAAQPAHKLLTPEGYRLTGGDPLQPGFSSLPGTRRRGVEGVAD